MVAQPGLGDGHRLSAHPSLPPTSFCGSRVGPSVLARGRSSSSLHVRSPTGAVGAPLQIKRPDPGTDAPQAGERAEPDTCSTDPEGGPPTAVLDLAASLSSGPLASMQTEQATKEVASSSSPAATVPRVSATVRGQSVNLACNPLLSWHGNGFRKDPSEHFEQASPITTTTTKLTPRVSIL